MEGGSKERGKTKTLDHRGDDFFFFGLNDSRERERERASERASERENWITRMLATEQVRLFIFSFSDSILSFSFSRAPELVRRVKLEKILYTEDGSQ